MDTGSTNVEQVLSQFDKNTVMWPGITYCTCSRESEWQDGLACTCGKYVRCACPVCGEKFVLKYLLAEHLPKKHTKWSEELLASYSYKPYDSTTKKYKSIPMKYITRELVTNKIKPLRISIVDTTNKPAVIKALQRSHAQHYSELCTLRSKV